MRGLRAHVPRMAASTCAEHCKALHGSQALLGPKILEFDAKAQKHGTQKTLDPKEQSFGADQGAV